MIERGGSGGGSGQVDGVSHTAQIMNMVVTRMERRSAWK